MKEGWVLISVSIDSSTGSSTKVSIRSRTPYNGKDNHQEILSNMIFNTDINHYKKSDVYLGS